MRKLKTEVNTPKMRARVMAAFRLRFNTKRIGPAAWFEHGQWWIVDNVTGAQWSVVDAEGGTSVDGFDFEQVSEGEHG